LLPRLANHGVELGFGVSNGLTPHIPRVTTPLTLSAVSWPALVMMGTTTTAAQTRRTRKQAP
jgi:hypothetical protein